MVKISTYCAQHWIPVFPPILKHPDNGWLIIITMTPSYFPAHCLLHTGNWTLHTLYLTLHTEHCKVFTKNVTLKTAQWILYIVCQPPNRQEHWAILNYRQSPKIKFMSNIFLIFYRLFYRHLRYSLINFATLSLKIFKTPSFQNRKS